VIARYTGVRPCDRYPGRLDRVVSSSQPKAPCETCGSKVSTRTGVRPPIVLPAKMPRGVKGKIATH